jgi:hypothetical protein
MSERHHATRRARHAHTEERCKLCSVIIADADHAQARMRCTICGYAAHLCASCRPQRRCRRCSAGFLLNKTERSSPWMRLRCWGWTVARWLRPR